MSLGLFRLGRRADWLLWGVALLSLPLAIIPTYLADSFRYSVEIAGHQAGKAGPYWEFGHLLWRPWGYAGLVLLGGWFRDWFGDDAVRATARFLICTSWACFVAAMLMITGLIRKVATGWPAWLAIASVVASNAVLNYSQAASPYVPAFAWTTCALFLLARTQQSKRPVSVAGLAGVAYAVAICLWFPFAVVGLGIVLTSWVSAPRDQRMKVLAALLGSLAATTVVFYGYGMVQGNIRSTAEFIEWVRGSNSGWNQQMNLVRVASGVPRGWFELGNDTVILKRWFFKDPYNPAGIGVVLGSIAWKLGVFYVAVFAWVVGAFRTRQAWHAIAAAAVVPLLGFAVFVFEPSSAERFLPAFPFLAPSFAALLGTRKPIRFAAALLPLAMIAGNLTTLTSSSNERLLEVVHRLQSVPVTPDASARIGLLTLRDDIYQLANVRIFDRQLNDPRRPFVDVITVGSTHSVIWRQDFARYVLEAWSDGQEFWFSERLLAERPAAAWLWVEGDDPSVHWAEITAFFRQLDTDLRVRPGRDGFLRVARTVPNRVVLEELLQSASMRGR